MTLHHTMVKLKTTKVGIRKWFVAMKNMTMLTFWFVLFVGMWKTMEFWTRKQFSSVISIHKAIPEAVWMVVLKSKQTGDMT